MLNFLKLMFCFMNSVFKFVIIILFILILIKFYNIPYKYNKFSLFLDKIYNI